MSDRLTQTKETIKQPWLSKESGDRQLRKEVALSLAVIADALSWQVEQEIHDRNSGWSRP